MSAILDASGRPFVSGAAVMPPRARAGVPLPDGTLSVPGMAGSMYPYEASSLYSSEMADWNPTIRSPDSEINMFRDRMVARSRDLVRNNGWGEGAISRILDNTVGTNLRLLAMPDYRALRTRFRLKAFDEIWAQEFRQAAEALWRGFADNPGRWNDVTCRMTVGQQFRVGMRHKLIDGDNLNLCYWMPERVGYGCSDYATCFLLMDPDRLSNPWMAMDTKFMRGGVEINTTGVPMAYHIRRAEQYDWYNTVESNSWERVPRYDSDGWRRVIHDYDVQRAGQNRGVGVFSPVISQMKMLARYYGVELQQATLAAMFGLYATSPYDPAQVEEALGAGPDDDIELSAYQRMRSGHHNERQLAVNGVRMATLFPGEKLETVASPHPHSNFSAFSHEMLCVFASSIGIAVEQITQDWSKTSYSSARASLMEAWKSLLRRRGDFTLNTASPCYGVWLREAMENGELPLPLGAPDYMEAQAAYTRCRWLGPARGWVDPAKEPAGAILRLEAGTSSLEAEAAEQGLDWEENLHQLAIERRAYDEAGVPFPAWGNVNGALDPAGNGDESIESNKQGSSR